MSDIELARIKRMSLGDLIEQDLSNRKLLIDFLSSALYNKFISIEGEKKKMEFKLRIISELRSRFTFLNKEDYFNVFLEHLSVIIDRLYRGEFGTTGEKNNFMNEIYVEVLEFISLYEPHHKNN